MNRSHDAPAPRDAAWVADWVAAELRAAGCVHAEDEAELLVEAARVRGADDADDGTLRAMVRERCAGSPLEHVLGWAEFGGLRILVRSPVFVPRRRTERLVDEALRGLPQHATVIDLCCGSGAVGAVVAARVPTAVVHATDLDPEATRCAEENLARFGPQHRSYTGDLFDPLPAGLRGTVDLVTANVPYVPTGELALLPREARDHEPATALDGGADGLDLLRRVSDGVGPWLRPGGRVVFEVSISQQPDAVAAVTAAGLRAHASAEDEGTVVICGTLPLA